MDEFQQLWPLMADHHRSTDAYFELLSLISNKTDAGPDKGNSLISLTGSSHLHLTGATLEYLKCRLLQCMFPTVQVLRMLPVNLCVDVSWKAVLHMTHILKRSPEADLALKLVNLLVHIDWPDEHMESIEKQVFPVLEGCRSHVDESDDYWLCWISSSNHTLLKRFLLYMSSHGMAITYSSKDMFMLAVTRKEHFMEALLSEDNIEISDHMKAMVFLIRLISTMETFVVKEQTLSQLTVCGSYFRSEGLHRTIFLDLKRICALQSRLNYLVPNLNMTSFTCGFNVIDFLNSNLELETIDYERIAIILQENQELNAELSALSPCETISSELELYEQFTVVRMIRSVICGSPTSTDLVSKCKRSLQNIRTLKGFIATLRAVVTLIFLRWDHVTHVDLDRTIESGSESEMKANDLGHVQNRPIKMRTYERFGFVCSVDSLSLVLRTLRHAISKRRHSDEFANAAESDLSQFESASEVISDAAWRLSLFRSSEDNHSFIQPSEMDIKMYLRVHQLDSNTKSKSDSSDEEVEDTHDQGGNVLSDVVGNGCRGRRKKDRMCVTLPRRKPRKKVPFGRGDGERKMSFSHSTENEQTRPSGFHQRNTDDENDVVDPSVRASNRRGRIHRRKSVMSKMLGTPEHLMTVCMNKGDLKTTRQLFKDHGPAAPHLTAELNFTESFNLTKEKLRHIFVLYRQQEEGTVSNLAPNWSVATNSRQTVDRIKKVAGLGFEASKITNIIASFSTQNQLCLPKSIESTLKRFADKYPFLKQYQPGGSLQATIVCDLVLSLAHNPDIALNMFSVLTKMWSSTDTISSSSSATTIGYFRFLRNLVDSMRLTVQNRGEAIGAQDFLVDDFLTTNTKDLVGQLLREDMLRNLSQIPESDYDTLEKLHAILPIFDVFVKGPDGVILFQRFMQFITNVYKLLRLSDDVQSELTPSEVLDLNLQATVGKILFVSRVFPSDIETTTNGIHMNLVHVITMNLSAEIEAPRNDINLIAVGQILDNMNNSNEEDEEIGDKSVGGMFECKNAVVFDYVSKHSVLLSYLLQHLLKGIDEEDGVSLAGCEQNFVENLLAVEAVRCLSHISGNNIWRAALSFDRTNVETVCTFLVKTNDFENSLQATRSLKCFHRIENRVSAHHLQTWLIQHVLLTCPSDANYCLIEHINDINIRAKCLLDNLLRIDDYTTAVRLIRSTLLHKYKESLNSDYQQHLREWLQNLTIYSAIVLIFNTKCKPPKTWLNVMSMSNNEPEAVLDLLLSVNEFSLCLQWSHIHPMTYKSDKTPTIIRIFTEAVVRLDSMNAELFKLIETLTVEVVLEMYIKLIRSVQNVSVLRYIINYLQSHKTVDRCLVHTINVSLTIVEFSESDPPWHLMSTPLMIIEQYLMNSRFDALAKILNGARPVLGTDPCGYCFQLRNQFIDSSYTFPIIPKSFSDSERDETSFQNEFSHSRDHCLSEDCVDSLLRIYATKALDFRIIGSHSSSDDLLSHGTDQTIASMDSLLSTFIMPREAPTRSNWIRDDEATHCMCCRRAVFTMLTRRHHCRQCGRVVCHACSTQRALIPALYADVRVRVCDDCHRQLELDKLKLAANAPSSESTRSASPCINSPLMSFHPGRSITAGNSMEWSFSGNLRHDELLRDEFCYEFAPSVSLCLSILTLHSTNDTECAYFLLLHCRKFESLLRPLHPGNPNPEIDYAMVTRMLNCLALAAKVRGGPPECDVVLEHAEIIRAVVLHRCESLLPMEPLNHSSFRKLRDALVLAEKWTLALEVSLKCGFSTTGVMAAWGIACLKYGCFETAREKFQHCLNKIGTDDEIFKLFTLVSYESTFNINNPEELPCPKRPTKSPPLLAEIVHILELTSHPTQPNVMSQAANIRKSNASLTAENRSQRIRSDDIPSHEPAINITRTLANLKNISAGIHENAEIDSNRNPSKTTPKIDTKRMSPNSRFYDECLFYLTTYSNHNDILAFLVKHNEIRTALKYVHCQHVDAEHFVRTLFMPYLRKGRAATVVQYMIEMDETLLIWKPYIIPLCAHLERSGFLNCLYLLQILFKDPVRASMTCVRFYEKNCSTYLDLLGQSFHLSNAEMHLTKELDMCQWEEIRVHSGEPSRKTSSSDGTRTPMPQRSLLMKMDLKTLNGHINTISRQLEVTKFLASCEQAGRPTVKLLPKMFMQSTSLPTLFGSTKDKIQLAILVLVCGINVTEGFGLAFRIIQDCNLDAELIYMSVAKHLASNQQLQRVEQLIECIRGNSMSSAGGPETRLCDRILGMAVDVFCGTGVSLSSDVPGRDAFERIVKQIKDVGIRINCHISGGQLKSAYLLAVQHEREADIRRVWRKAEATNQIQIRKLCERKLNILPK